MPFGGPVTHCVRWVSLAPQGRADLGSAATRWTQTTSRYSTFYQITFPRSCRILSFDAV